MNYEQAGQEIGKIVDSKQAQYGDMISAMGPILRILYPSGISPAQYDDLALVVRIMDKVGRITRGNGKGNESPYLDLAGYGLLGDAQCQKLK